MYSFQKYRQESFDKAVAEAEKALTAGGNSAKRASYRLADIHAVDSELARDIAERAARAIANYPDDIASMRCWLYLSERHPGALTALFEDKAYFASLSPRVAGLSLLANAEPALAARLAAQELNERFGAMTPRSASEALGESRDAGMLGRLMVRGGLRDEPIFSGSRATARDFVVLRASAPEIDQAAPYRAELAAEATRRGDLGAAKDFLEPVRRAAEDKRRIPAARVSFASEFRQGGASNEDCRALYAGIVSASVRNLIEKGEESDAYGVPYSPWLPDAMKKLADCGGKLEVMHACLALACSDRVRADMQVSWARTGARLCAPDDYCGKLLGDSLNYMLDRNGSAKVTRGHVELLSELRRFPMQRDRAIGRLREIALGGAQYPEVRVMAAEAAFGVPQDDCRDPNSPEVVLAEPSWARREHIAANAVEIGHMMDGIAKDCLARVDAADSSDENRYCGVGAAVNLLAEAGEYEQSVGIACEVLRTARFAGVRAGLVPLADNAFKHALVSGDAALAKAAAKDIRETIEVLADHDTQDGWRKKWLSKHVAELESAVARPMKI